MERFYTCQCGAKLDMQGAVDGVVKCPYCGNKVAVPREQISPEALHMLRNGKLELCSCHFERATVAYQNAAQLAPEEPEAYFGMALAAFKVQYLKDEVNDCWQPICHEISDKVFTDDKNYRKALELATVEQKKVYRKQGQEIDDIRDEFYALEKSGLNFDCFICVKVSDDDNRDSAGNKQPTQDSFTAHDIYTDLQSNGYKPFYSERDVRSRSGSAYEAMILYALYKSECMLIVCSNAEYLKTPWVKNEYSRFYAMLANDEKDRDAVAFVFNGKAIEKLPNGKKLQGIDYNWKDAYLLIRQFVENHTPRAKQQREDARKKEKEEAERQKKRVEAQDKKIEELQRIIAAMAKPTPTAEEPKSGIQIIAPRDISTQKAKEQPKKEEPRKAVEVSNTPFAPKFSAPPTQNKSDFQISGYILRKYKGYNSHVSIPDGVVEIANSAFANCQGVTNLTIPTRVKRVGWKAFDGCKGLKTVNYLGTVEEWCNIFWGDPTSNPLFYAHNLYLKGKHVGDVITIPTTVKEIKHHAFVGAAIKGINFCRGVVTIGRRAFANCNNITEIKLPDTVTSISDGAFENCKNLTSVTLPDSLMSIVSGAFVGCDSLVNVVISKKFEWQLADIFGEQCSKIKFTYIGEPQEQTIAVETPQEQPQPQQSSYPTLGNYDKAEFEIKGTVLKKYTGQSVYEIKIPQGVTEIEQFAFSNCAKFTEIYIPDTVTKLNKFAFDSRGVTPRSIPSKLTKISDYAFNGCKFLDLTIPHGVTQIGKWAFAHCSAQNSVTIPPTVKEIGEGAFAHWDGMTQLTLPDSVETIGKYAFNDLKLLDSFVIPNSVKRIGRLAFGDCQWLRKVTMPKRLAGKSNEKLEEIFQGCDLEKIKFTFTD